MSDETNFRPSADDSAATCSAADALKLAKAELEKAQAFYDHLRQQAAEQLKVVRRTTVGDMVDGTLEAARRHPAAGLTLAAIAGYFLGRLFRR
ncbi:MAG: hypothetical protein LLG00_12255 [Planctomycetaceae bacterium]|nr:hypothetical protein [Planctomycetaceae bacterium]